MESSPIRVLIADDHEVVGEALSLYLENDTNIRVINTLHSGVEALKVAQAEKPHILLLDLRLPDMDGLQVLSELRTAAAIPRVVIITAYPTEQHVAKALALGASGFISKDIALHQIPGVIRAVMAGKSVVLSPSLGVAFQREQADREADMDAEESGSKALSPQETEIIHLLIEGLANKEIGQQLSTSEGQVKKILSEVYEKVGVRNRTELVIWASTQGFM